MGSSAELPPNIEPGNSRLNDPESLARYMKQLDLIKQGTDEARLERKMKIVKELHPDWSDDYARSYSIAQINTEKTEKTGTKREEHDPLMN
jgi:hypothetical protein